MFTLPSLLGYIIFIYRYYTIVYNLFKKYLFRLICYIALMPLSLNEISHNYYNDVNSL